jgi:type I restriction enzyme S subunit
VDVSERNPASRGLERIVGLEHIEPGSLHIREWGDLIDGTSFSRTFRTGQVLFGKRRAYQRKVAYAEFDGICSGDILVFEAVSDDLLPELLPFIVQSEPFFEHALQTSAGSLSPRTKWTELAKYEFALPPKDEQRRIAEILWAADAVTLRLQSAHEACARLIDRELGELESLRQYQVTIGESVRRGLLFPPQDGNHGAKHPKARDFRTGGVPFVMSNNVRDGCVDLLGCKFISPELAAGLRIGFARTNDVLLTHKGTVGEVAIVLILETQYIMLTPQVTYYRVKDPTQLDFRYVAIALRSGSFQRQLQRASSQSTRDYVGIVGQRRLLITIPPLPMQLSLLARTSALDQSLSQLESHCEISTLLAKRAASQLLLPGGSYVQ